MADVKFSDYNNIAILCIDLTESTPDNQEFFIKKAGKLMSMYRKKEPLFVLYDLRGVQATRLLLELTGEHLLKNSGKVERRVFLVDSEEAMRVTMTLMNSRELVENSAWTGDLEAAKKYLNTGVQPPLPIIMPEL